MTEDITVKTTMTVDDREQLIDAFGDRLLVDVVVEHEGMTHTFIFERPHGHIGLSISLMVGKPKQIGVGLSEWVKDPHHETDDWVWHRIENSDIAVNEEANNE